MEETVVATIAKLLVFACLIWLVFDMFYSLNHQISFRRKSKTHKISVKKICLIVLAISLITFFIFKK